MRRNVGSFLVIALVTWFVTPASAQVFASGSGSGTACSAAAPCSLSQAIVTVNAGGVVNLIDTSLNTPLISKSLTIRGVTDSAAITYPSSFGGANITVQAGSTDLVTIDNVRLSGGGVLFVSGGHLQVLNSTIGDQIGVREAGISFKPSAAAKLSVVNTVIKNVGNGTGGGIVINPSSGGSARVNIERSAINGGAFGIAADGTGSTAGINMTIADSMIGGASQDGIIATTPSGGAPIGVYLARTQSVNNNIGVRSLGPNVTIRMRQSDVIGNGTGLVFGGGGALLSTGDNVVQANATNGSFSGGVALQ